MKIEILYSDVCNLYGDLENIYFLQKIFDNVTIIETKLNDKPKFISEEIDMVYIGSCPFTKTSFLVSKLLPYKKDIEKRIKDNKLFLATGTSAELFGKYVISDEGKFDGLGIYNYYSKRVENRINSFFLGEFNDIKIVGNKSQFFFLKDVNSKFIKVTKGHGNDEKDEFEGIKDNNFYITSLLGPFLILNPKFVEYLFKKDEYKYKKEAYDAYNYRLEKLEEKDARIVMGDHG